MSEPDWKVVESALDMWRASQVAIRGHVQVVSEAVGRLRERERNFQHNAAKALDEQEAHWKARVAELEAEVKRLQSILDKF